MCNDSNNGRELCERITALYSGVYGRTLPLSEETLCWFASFDCWETLRLFRADFLYAGLGLLAGP